MKLFKDAKFGKIKEPESFDELIKIFLDIDIELGGTSVRYWRGQSNIEWPIESSAHRRLKKTELYSESNLNKILERYEEQLIEQACHKGYNYQDGRKLYDLELLAKLQHHGAATRLVDFSKNALIGLWFSVIDNHDKTGLLIGIHTDIVYGHENIIEKRTYKDVIKECNDFRKGIFTWEPTIVSPRMAAQHSQFLYSSLSNDKKGSLNLPEEEYYLTLIAINPKLKENIKNILKNIFDIWTISIFPDIDGFGKANNHLTSRWDMDRW